MYNYKTPIIRISSFDKHDIIVTSLGVTATDEAVRNWQSKANMADTSGSGGTQTAVAKINYKDLMAE